MSKLKRIGIFALLVACVLFTTATVADAQPRRLGPWDEVKTLVSVNTATGAAGDVSLTVLASTTDLTIKTDRILGFVVVPANAAYNSELTLGLYDATTAATLTEANVFDEAEWDDDGNNQPRWYPYPKRLARGLCFIQGSNTVVIIYYETV